MNATGLNMSDPKKNDKHEMYVLYFKYFKYLYIYLEPPHSFKFQHLPLFDASVIVIFGCSLVIDSS